MASIHMLALSHIAIVAVGLALIASVLSRIAQRKAPHVRAAYPQPRRRPRRFLLPFGYRLLRAAVRFAGTLGLALAGPLGMLCANRRYPAVAPVLAAFEQRVAECGHRIGRARCFPLMFSTIWLIRCSGCRRRGLFREVPTADGLAIDLMVLDKSLGKAQHCAAEYLIAPSI